MRILVVSPPVFTRRMGATQKEILTNIELLKDMGHTVILYAISTGYSYEKEAAPQASRELGIDIRIFYPNLRDWLWWIRQVITSDWTYVDRASYVFGLMSEDREFNEFLESYKPEMIVSHFCFSWPILMLANKKRIPGVLRSHNFEATFFVESLSLFERFYPQNWIRFVAKWFEEKKAARYSNAIAALPFDGVKYYKKWQDEGKVFILTLNYPYKSIREPFVHKNKRPLDVFYLGASYNISFHLAGAKLLIEKIAPEVHRLAPGEFRFHICGGGLPEYLQKQCDAINTIYEGYVEDFEEFMSRMDIAAFPTKTGSTLKGKVSDTIARAFPMVIPSNCLGNYNLESGNEIILAESTDEFAAAIISLKDDLLREKLSRGAAKFAKNTFAKEVLVDIIESIFERARKVSVYK